MQRRNFLIAALSSVTELEYFEDDTEEVIIFSRQKPCISLQALLQTEKENIHQVFKILCYSAAWLFWEGESASANTPSLRAVVFSSPW